MAAKKPKMNTYTILIGSIKDPQTGKVTGPGGFVTLPEEEGDRLVLLGNLAPGQVATPENVKQNADDVQSLRTNLAIAHRQIETVTAERDAALADLEKARKVSGPQEKAEENKVDGGPDLLKESK